MSSLTNLAVLPEPLVPDDEDDEEPEDEPELEDPDEEPDEPEDCVPDELVEPLEELPDAVEVEMDVDPFDEVPELEPARVAAHPALNSATVASTASRTNLHSLFKTAFPVTWFSRSLPTGSMLSRETEILQ